jgi:hypothetical protein
VTWPFFMGQTRRFVVWMLNSLLLWLAVGMIILGYYYVQALSSGRQESASRLGTSIVLLIPFIVILGTVRLLAGRRTVVDAVGSAGAADSVAREYAATPALSSPPEFTMAVDRRKAWRNIMILGSIAILVTAAGWTSSKPPLWAIVVADLGLVISCVYTGRLLRMPQPIVRVTDDGIIDRRLREPLIPWGEIRKITERRQLFQFMELTWIELTAPNADRYRRGMDIAAWFSWGEARRSTIWLEAHLLVGGTQGLAAGIDRLRPRQLAMLVDSGR